MGVRAASDDPDANRTGDIDVLGIPVRCGSARSVEAAILGFLADPWDGRCRHVATVNPEYVMEARSNPAFAAQLRQTDLNTVDGIGVLLAVRFSGQRTAERLSGVDIVQLLVRNSGPHRAPLFLLGSRSGIADRAIDHLQRDAPDLRYAGGWADGRADASDDGEALRRIAASGASVLFVAYGAVGQVAFIERNIEHLGKCGVRLAVGIGGALDMLSGTTRRAPRPIRRVGLEWLFRLLIEPWRWRRQMVLPKFGFLIIRDRFRPIR